MFFETTPKTLWKNSIHNSKQNSQLNMNKTQSKLKTNSLLAHRHSKRFVYSFAICRAGSSGLSSRSLLQLGRTGSKHAPKLRHTRPLPSVVEFSDLFAFSVFAPDSPPVERGGFEPEAGLHQVRPLSSGMNFDDFPTFLSPTSWMRL